MQTRLMAKCWNGKPQQKELMVTTIWGMIGSTPVIDGDSRPRAEETAPGMATGDGTIFSGFGKSLAGAQRPRSFMLLTMGKV